MSESLGQKRSRGGMNDRDDYDNNGDDHGRRNYHRRDPKRHRGSGSGEHGSTANKQQHESNNTKKTNFDLERQQRMARLRQEMKEEDMELAALDERAAEAAGEGGGGGGLSSGRSNKVNPQEEVVEVNPEELEDLDEDEQMMKLMGIQGFGSTKGEAVEDNQKSAARGVAAKNKARKYRQYMNRKNGFNRPLEKMN